MRFRQVWLQYLNDGRVRVHFFDKQWRMQVFTLYHDKGRALFDHVLADCLLERVLQLEAEKFNQALKQANLSLSVAAE
jgi:hypothetical protein